MPTDSPPDHARRPATAAFLSFLFPGAGQYYAGARRAAAIFAAPAILLILFLLLQIPGGIDTFAAQMIAPSFALWTLLVIVLLGAWRLASIGLAFQRFSPVARRRRPALAALAVVVAGVVLMHGVAGYYAWSFYDAGSQIFVRPHARTQPVAIGRQLAGADGYEPVRDAERHPSAAGEPGYVPDHWR